MTMKFMKSRASFAAILLAFTAACADRDAAGSGSPGALVKGGDERTGPYEPVADFWKPAPDHTEEWTWGEVSGLAVDNPNRIIVAVWGDRNAQNQGREGTSNYLLVVDRNGNIVENWAQWDSIVNRPHQVYIGPYDPERHVWIVERGQRGVPMSVLKFTNDGSQLVMRLFDPNHPTSRAEARANPNPGPYSYGDPAVLAFFPDGTWLLGDGYWNTRVVKYAANGDYIMEWGEPGTGPGQFDLVHGLAIDRDHRVYVADRNNNRIQIFTEDGEYIEEWPDVTDPVGVFIDENDHVWVTSGRLNRILEYSLQGELLYYWGAYGGTMGGFDGGLSRPHQIDVDQEGNVYVASWDGGWLDKFVPKPGADPSRLIGRALVLER
jgi:hypothetical protein